MDNMISPLKKSIRYLGLTFFSLFFRLFPRNIKNNNLDKLGINFVGLAFAEMGLGEALRSMVWSARSAAIPFLIRKFNPSILGRSMNLEMLPFLKDSCTYPINCFCVNPDIAFRIPLWLKYDEWGKRYNIGVWFWELPNFPKSWKYATFLVDEVWVNTEYVADAIRKGFDRVVKIPFSVDFDMNLGHFDRAHYGLPSTQFLFLFSYDFNSSTARKNPEAVISAFQKAFHSNVTNVGLIIKSINSDQNPSLLTKLKEMVAGNTQVYFIDKHLTTDEMRGLINTANCYISLHRSEGLGLGMAEAMYLGKPVIATAYSGNMEFMNEESACLVPYELTKVSPGDYPESKNQLWADPDIGVAANFMKKVYEDSSFSESIGLVAAAYMRKYHSHEVAGKAIAARLTEIQEMHMKVF
jgi:glycosyltransferase involved in cell wall biosynthesis